MLCCEKTQDSVYFHTYLLLLDSLIYKFIFYLNLRLKYFKALASIQPISQTHTHWQLSSVVSFLLQEITDSQLFKRSLLFTKPPEFQIMEQIAASIYHTLNT